MTLQTENRVAELLAARGVPAHVLAAGAAGLLSKWESFVSAAEAGYPFGLEDYRNDLDLRSLITLVKLDTEAAPADERFRALLHPTDTSVWQSDAPEAWWTRGYPRNAGPALLEDLRAERIL